MASVDEQRASKKRVGEVAVLGLYFIIDIGELWPWSRLLAVLTLAVACVCLLLYDGELSKSKIAVIGSVVALVGLFAARVIPLPREPMKVITGPLRPGGDPTPANACDTDPRLAGSLKIFLGQTGGALVFMGSANSTVISVGSCHLLTFETTPAGMNMSAELFDENGAHIASVHDNTVDAVAGNGLRIERPDLSSLRVVRGDDELIRVRYLNEKAVMLRGTFRCTNHAIVRIDDDGMTGGDSGGFKSACTIIGQNGTFTF